MHQNLEKRFINLEVARGMLSVKLMDFKARYHLLFAALAEEMGLTKENLAKRVGFDPCPEGGNSIMNGESEPSNEDVFRLLDVYLNVIRSRK